MDTNKTIGKLIEEARRHSGEPVSYGNRLSKIIEKPKL